MNSPLKLTTLMLSTFFLLFSFNTNTMETRHSMVENETIVKQYYE